VTGPGGAGWSIEERVGSARDLHGPWPSPGAQPHRAVAVCSVTDRAVVLGSTQHDDVVDRRRAVDGGVDVVRRGAGGGAVLVVPGGQVWLDTWLPRHDALWDDDVVRSSRWIGETWRCALEALGASGLRVHTGPATRSPWAQLVCFAGIGPGEVTTGGAKLVGVAQRRTRLGARLHSMAPLAWEPLELTALLASVPDACGPDELGGAATGLRAVVPGGADLDDDALVQRVVDALISALP